MAVSEQSDQLSTRSRVIAAVIAGVLGIVFSCVGTVAHQVSFVILGFGIPVGLFLALASIGAIALACRLLLPGRLPSYALAAGVILPIAVFSAESAGGSVLIPMGTLGSVWVFGPAILVVIVAAWPRTLRTEANRAGGNGTGSRPA